MKTITFIDIELCACSYDGTLQDFSLMLWVNFLKKENRKIVNLLARDLGIYPTPANVHEKIIFELTKHIAK